MQKVFAKKLKDDTFSFFEDDCNHLLKVLRIKNGDEIICIYEHNKYRCKIISTQPLLAKIIENINSFQQDYNLDLFQALIKPKSFEFIFKKSIEMNTTNFFPILFERSQKNLLNEIRLNTLSKVCSSQSNRNELMNVHDVLNYEQLINHLELSNYDLIIIPYEKEENNYLTMKDFEIPKINKIAIIVGPEGGFTNQEISKLENIKNTKLISLTKTILRSETASLYVLSIVNNFLLSKGK